MNKKTIGLIGAAVLGTLLSSSPAWAGGSKWVPSSSNPGSPHAAADNGTVRIETQHANNTWQDWYWRGKDHGMNFQCPWNNAGNCDFTVNNSFTSGSSFTIGGGVEAGATGGAWFSKAAPSLAANLNIARTTFKSTTVWAGMKASAGRGQFAEPVMIRVRNWKRGYFMNGWVLDPNGYEGSYASYDWVGNIKYGAWTGEIAIKDPYTTFYIHG